MNKIKTTCGFIYLITLIFMLNTTASAIPSSYGWASMPLIDAPNDVIESSNMMNPLHGSSTDTHPEVDILTITMHPTSPDIIMQFNATPIIGSDYMRSIYIDNTSDRQIDFVIMDLGSQIYLIHSIDLYTSHYWNSTHQLWQETYCQLNYSIAGNNITYETVGVAIPNIADAQISGYAAYGGEVPDWIYSDPAPGSSGIPAFSISPLIFGLIAILGLVFFIRKKRVNF
jgi:hypothetical protein